MNTTEDRIQLALSAMDRAEEIVAANLAKELKEYLVNNLPSLRGRVPVIIILTNFRKSLISQKAKDSITEAIKELYHESKRF